MHVKRSWGMPMSSIAWLSQFMPMPYGKGGKGPLILHKATAFNHLSFRWSA